MKLKKLELEQSLLQISSFSPETNTMIGGLLTEELTLGTKRALHKIHKVILASYKELIDDSKKVKEECGEDKEKYENEMKELLNEEVELNIEPIKWSFLESVSSKSNYNFDLIDKMTV